MQWQTPPRQLPIAEQPWMQHCGGEGAASATSWVTCVLGRGGRWADEVLASSQGKDAAFVTLAGSSSCQSPADLATDAGSVPEMLVPVSRALCVSASQEGCMCQ